MREAAMGMYQELLQGCVEGKILDVRVGIHWTTVVAEVEGGRRCGLASTLAGPRRHGGEPAFPQAGHLEELAGRQLAAWVSEDRPGLASVGAAAINALLPLPPRDQWVDLNAEQLIGERGAGKRVVLVGSFPFTSRLRHCVGELIVLEREPQVGELPGEKASDVIPEADVVAITGMTFVNHTLEGLLELCPERAFVTVVGPSTPLSPVLFKHGVDVLCGAVVTEIDPVVRAVSQGADFRQLHKAGVRLLAVRGD